MISNTIKYTNVNKKVFLSILFVNYLGWKKNIDQKREKKQMIFQKVEKINKKPIDENKILLFQTIMITD